MFGAFLTFWLLTLVVGSRQEKERLIRQMGSEFNDEAKRAVRELRANGWLLDGTLKGLRLDDANLEAVDLTKANLEDVKMWDPNLQNADLSGSCLQRVYLVRPSLQGAKLAGSDMQQASLYEANLYGANLLFANLQNASLKYANLELAQLEYANLKGANLEYARIYNHSFDENVILPDAACILRAQICADSLTRDILNFGNRTILIHPLGGIVLGKPVQKRL